MMLPFVLAALGLGAALAGRRGAAIALWSVTLALYAVTLVSHMTDRLAISL
jgi:Family of unknown function (DUF5993)